MVDTIGSGLDHAGTGPAIRSIEITRPFGWLARGARDVVRAPVISLSYGVAFALIGAVLLSLVWARQHFALTLISGFALVAPFLAINLYALSRMLERGEEVTAAQIFRAGQRNPGSIALFGLVLVIALIAWERLSAILFAVFYGGEVPNLANFAADVLLSGKYVPLVVVYLGAGAVAAALVFAVSVVSLPMLLDRDVDAVTALITSLRAVHANPGPMIVWALTIAVLTAFGLATWLVGLVLVFPILGHASWHAYRDMVD